MNQADTTELKNAFPSLQENLSLKSYSTFKIGGPADYFLVVKNKDELKNAYCAAKKANLNVFILGGGSNVLFADEGFRGLVIKNEATHLEVKGTEIWMESGVLWSQLIQAAVQNNLQGVEKMMGLPGTMGAAVRGNAGCHGVETRDLLKSATVLDEKSGEEIEVGPEYFKFDYRESLIKKSAQLVLTVTFQLERHTGSEDELRKTMKDLLLDRRDKQPTGKNAGSFFKNPDANSAGHLIEAAGLKGERVGDAQVSEQHANFFMNLGEATQSDIVKLARKVAETVYNKAKIRLVNEVHIIDQYGKALEVV